MALILFLILLILCIVLGWHIIFALLGGAIILGAAGLIVATISVVIFSIAMLLVFFLTGAVGLAIGIIFAGWTIVAIILFPVLFPILLPLFIIFAFIFYMRKKNRKL